MFYIRTADRLVRTARWIEQFDGGIEKLKRIIIDDELGIGADLDAEMDALVGTYVDEWAKVVEDPILRASFKQFVNSVSFFFLLQFFKLSRIEILNRSYFSFTG